MLAINNLSIAYGHSPILQGVTFEVIPGEIVSLIGPNGAGKTSLLNAVSGVITPSSGTIHINRQILSEFSPRQRARLMGFVPQARLLPPTFTVWQTVMIGRTPHLGLIGKPAKDDIAAVEFALGRVELHEFTNRPIGELSGGEQQRVLLARALAQNAPILLMDEPTAHLDIRFQASFLNLVRDLVTEKELAVLMALHDLNLAAVYSDRIVLLADGNMVNSGEPETVLTSEILSAAYHIPIEVIPHPQNKHPLILVSKADKYD